MSNKKRMILVLTAVMVLSVAIGSFAKGTELSFDGSCKKNFLSSDYVEKTSSENWSLFCVKLKSITGGNGDTFAYARPETSSGETCGTRFKIEPIKNDPDGTSYLPNNRGKTTNEIHVKLFTTAYVDNGVSSSSSVHLVGTMTGTK